MNKMVPEFLDDRRVIYEIEQTHPRSVAHQRWFRDEYASTPEGIPRIKLLVSEMYYAARRIGDDAKSFETEIFPVVDQLTAKSEELFLMYNDPSKYERYQQAHKASAEGCACWGLGAAQRWRGLWRQASYARILRITFAVQRMMIRHFVETPQFKEAMNEFRASILSALDPDFRNLAQSGIYQSHLISVERIKALLDDVRRRDEEEITNPDNTRDGRSYA